MNSLRQRLLLTFLPVVTAVLLLFPYFAFAAEEKANLAQKFVWGLVVAVTGRLVWIGGAILDAGINTFVIGFGDIFLRSGVGIAVDSTWVVIRDFLNLLFIFGLVYIGFRMILGSDNANVRRWLVNLIIAAILINFSLFITKFVVDFSNRLSTEIAQAAFETNGGRVTMSDTIMNRMGIQTILGNNSNGQSSISNLAEKNAWGYIFGTAIFFIITAFVFAAGGVLLIIRFAILSFYIVLSPIMFVGWILPTQRLGNIMGEYWRGFFSQAFFAPVYFLFIYFSLTIITNFQQSLPGLQSGAWVNAMSGDGASAVGSSSVLPFFVLICIFMMLSLVAAQKMGAQGANAAISYGQQARRYVQRNVTRGAGAATAGVTASGLRNTVGRRAYAYTQSDTAKLKAASGLGGKLQYKANQYLAGASFDARQVGGVGKSTGLGEGRKGGFEKQLKDKKAADAKFAKDLGFVDTDSAEGKARVAAKTNEIKTEAEREKAAAAGARKEFEENLNTASATFATSINVLATEIQGLEKQLADDDAAGKLTDNEKANRQKDIDTKKKELASKKSAETSIKRVEEARNKAIMARNALTAYTGDERGRVALQNELDKANAAWGQAAETEKAAYAAAEKAADDKANEAAITAEAGIKYERQLAYMASKRKSIRFWNSATVLSGSGVGAGLGGMLTLGAINPILGGIYGATAATAAVSGASSKGYTAEEELKALEKEYGTDGKKLLKKTKKQEKAKDQIAALKDLSGEEEKGDDKK